VKSVIKAFAAGALNVGTLGGLALVQLPPSAHRLGPFAPFAFSLQYSVTPFGRSTVGVYASPLAVAFTTVVANPADVDTWIVWFVGFGALPPYAAHSNFGRVVKARSALVSPVGADSAVRNVRTADHRLYCPLPFHDLTRQWYVAFGFRSGVTAQVEVPAFASRTIAPPNPALVATCTW
jgi:hypothetical protein